MPPGFPPTDDDTIVDEAFTPEIEPALGELFAGRYRIERCLGRGGMGTVYAAHDRVVDEHVALKLLATPSERALERFRREVRLARRVTHRNAARTFDLGEVGGAHFITMELVAGESLRVRLARQHRMTAAEVIATGHQICLGLHAAHDVDVIHRDLKPANVLVEPSGRAVVTDFGVAYSSADSSQQTQESSPMAGTPAYMAPEQVMGMPADARSDLYALGVMLYEMLTGQAPWQGENRVEVAMARLHQPVPDPRAVVSVPDHLADLVMACMARAPEARPASGLAMARALAALAGPKRPPTTSTMMAVRDDATDSSAGNSMIASASPGARALAVMPFRYRGPADEAYLAETLTEELIDLLAMTRGLRVSARGATAAFEDERDARTVGRALGVDAIVDGTVHRSATSVRIVARLIDVGTGFQSWSERFEGPLEDVFELEDRMAKRIAEALRLELTLMGHGAVASAEAVEQYLRGRTLARTMDPTGRSLEHAIDRFVQAHKLAPGFALPVAARAEATVRRWFLTREDDQAHWARASRDAVALALERAPNVAESHLAAARLSVHQGDFRTAAEYLVTALEIAPTYAAAHEYLGQLQCDAGRPREGVRHIRLAQELDPSQGLGRFAVLRYVAFEGDSPAYQEMLERLRADPNLPTFAVDLFELRFALWHGDIERIKQLRPQRASLGGTSTLDIFGAIANVIDRELDDAVLVEGMKRAATLAGNPRLRTAWRQIAIEALAWRGLHEAAIEQLEQADAEGVLADTDWFERCPLLVPLRDHPKLREIEERVRQRADAIWRVDRSARSS